MDLSDLAEPGGHPVGLFHEAAWYYARFRPPYPDALFDYLIRKFDLGGRSNLLDLGCGTGQVANPLPRRFRQVTIALLHRSYIVVSIAEGTVEEVFAQARDAVSEAEELLVDVDWRTVEVEPETIEVNGNGRDDLFGIGPTVELVPGTGHHVNGVTNGHAPVPVNEHHEDEADEPQRTLFSWAEFIAAGPARPKRRRRTAQVETASLFEWALTLEQERQAELVGAER